MDIFLWLLAFMTQLAYENCQLRLDPIPKYLLSTAKLVPMSLIIIAVSGTQLWLFLSGCLLHKCAQWIGMKTKCSLCSVVYICMGFILPGWKYHVVVFQRGLFECELAVSLKMPQITTSLFLLISSFSTPDPIPHRGSLKYVPNFSSSKARWVQPTNYKWIFGVWMKDTLPSPIISAVLFICGIWSSWQRIIVHWNSEFPGKLKIASHLDMFEGRTSKINSTLELLGPMPRKEGQKLTQNLIFMIKELDQGAVMWTVRIKRQGTVKSNIPKSLRD